MIIIGALPSPAQADFDQAVTAWRNGRTAEAVAEWRRLAEGGDLAAQYNLAVLSLKGEGVPLDLAGGLAWLARAADGGDAVSQEMLGTMALRGDRVPRDYGRAFTLLSRAAEAGLPAARNNLAVIYLGGLGRPADPAKALALANLAASAGNPDAPRVAEMARARMSTLPPAAPAPAPAQSPAGARPFSVQLASAGSRAEAERRWGELSGKLKGLRGRRPEYKEVDLGPKGRKVRVFLGGFADRAAAESVCRGLAAEGGDCLVVADQAYH